MDSNVQNKLTNKTGPEAWIYGTDWQMSGGGEGDWIKKVKRLAKEHTCIARGHRQQCGEAGWGAQGGGRTGGENGGHP